MKTLAQDIKTGQFRRVYLLYGEETFLKRSYKNQLKAAIVGDDEMNFHYFEGKDIDIREIISLADTMPFFGDRRMLLIEDSGFFKSGGADELAAYIPGIPDTTCILFVESEVDKRSRMYKAVNENGYAAEMKRQDENQLASWAAALFARSGRKISARTMERFLNRTGDDMENIRMEIEKLISYTEGSDIITDKDVDTICTEQVTNRIFDMITAIAGRKPREALNLYEDLLTLKEPPMRILFLIARQFNQILQVKELMEAGYGRADIAGRLGIKPFAVGKTMPQARSFTREQILSYVDLCVESEEAVKTGRLQERLAVELLITGKY